MFFSIPPEPHSQVSAWPPLVGWLPSRPPVSFSLLKPPDQLQLGDLFISFSMLTNRTKQKHDRQGLWTTILYYYQGLVKGAILCFRNPYFYFQYGESTSTASQLTSPASQKSKDLNKVSLLLQDLALGTTWCWCLSWECSDIVEYQVLSSIWELAKISNQSMFCQDIWKQMTEELWSSQQKNKAPT